MHRFSLLAALLLPLATQAAELTLEVNGLDLARLDGSAVMVGVFTAPSQWLDQPALGRRFVLRPEDVQAVKASQGRLRVALSDLPEGPLAVSVFHDVNSNGKLDTNLVGLPVERYGFSNDAAGMFGPPRFEQAVMTPQTGALLRIQLN